MIPDLALYAFLALQCRQLSSDSFAEREAASQALTAHAKAARTMLENLPDPEARRRAEKILHKLAMDDAAIDLGLTLAKYPVLPWIDSYRNRPELWAAYLIPANQQTPAGLCTSPLWLNYRQATLLLVTDLYNAGWTRPEVEKLLDEMIIWEFMWRMEHFSMIEHVQFFLWLGLGL